MCLVEGFFGTNLIGSGRRTVPTGGKQASAAPSDISRSSGEKGLKLQPGTGGVGSSDSHRNGPEGITPASPPVPQGLRVIPVLSGGHSVQFEGDSRCDNNHAAWNL